MQPSSLGNPRSVAYSLARKMESGIKFVQMRNCWLWTRTLPPLTDATTSWNLLFFPTCTIHFAALQPGFRRTVELENPGSKISLLSSSYLLLLLISIRRKEGRSCLIEGSTRRPSFIFLRSCCSSSGDLSSSRLLRDQ